MQEGTHFTQSIGGWIYRPWYLHACAFTFAGGGVKRKITKPTTIATEATTDHQNLNPLFTTPSLAEPTMA